MRAVSVTLATDAIPSHLCYRIPSTPSAIPAQGVSHVSACRIEVTAVAEPIGQLLDRLGVAADIDADDLVSSAVVVMAVLVPGDSNPRLTIASSEGISWIEQAGLLRLAEVICSAPPDEDAE